MGCQNALECSFLTVNRPWTQLLNVFLKKNSELTDKQKSYRSTGSKKLVFDFKSDPYWFGWGLEAQIKCMVADEVNVCDTGAHDCEENAECVATSKTSYVCNCHQGEWGDGFITAKGAGTKTDRCVFFHPNDETKRLTSIKDRDYKNKFKIVKSVTWFGICYVVEITHLVKHINYY